MHIPPYAPPIEGGSERFCFNLCKKLINLGHEIKVFTSRKDNTKYKIIETVPCRFFRNYKHMLQLNPLSFIYHKLSSAVDWADIVHVHSYIYFLGNQVALYRRKRRFPFILHLHGGTSPITSKVYGRLPVLAKTLYDVTIGKWTIQSADIIMASSKNDALNAIERFDVDPRRIVLVPNSVYVDNFYSEPENPPIVTFLARLTQLKGCYLIPDILKRVYQEHKNVKFWIVGEGYVESFLRKELKGLPVRFWGAVPHAQVPDILAKSSVYYLPSYTESCPLAILEALASSVPVVAFNVGGISEAVSHGKTGFMAPVGNIELMAQYICELLDNDKLRRQIGREGRKKMEHERDWGSCVKKILKVYEGII